MTFGVPDGAPWCAGAHPVTTPPRFALPPLACDCHAHICGPIAPYRYADDRIDTPPDALLPDYRRMLDAIGIVRAVLVQPSVYGTDNTVLLQALQAGGSAVRGVAVLDPAVDDAELHRMHGSGVRGVRFNAVDRREGRNEVPLGQIVPLARRIAVLGWHVELLLQVDAVPTWRPSRSRSCSATWATSTSARAVRMRPGSRPSSAQSRLGVARRYGRG